jgi:ATP-dependent DNA helicase MPH1
MSADEEDYGDFADEDFIEAFSQASQVLPPHPRRDGTDSAASGDEEANGTSKKKKYRIHEGVDEVPKASM